MKTTPPTTRASLAAMPARATLAKKHRAQLRSYCYTNLLGEFWMLPATPEAYEAQVEAMMKRMWEVGCGPNVQDLNWKALAEVALAAIGIRRPSQ